MRWFYTPRRVDCPEHGVRVEAMPWNEGKRPWTKAMMVFLARWARRLSWQETAASFDVSWEAVYRSVRWIVAWGLEHRVLAGIRVVVSDMWRPYLAVVRKDMSQAVQILDRFHLTALLNKAVDLVQRRLIAPRRAKVQGV